MSAETTSGLIDLAPTEWTQKLDPTELAECEAIERWTLRTSGYVAHVTVHTWAPEVAHLTVIRSVDGPLCEDVEIESVDEAKESATVTIAEAIKSFS